MKPSRRRKGATLGLVASCVLVIIVLGMGVFFLAKLFGGGREVANATDAGTLSIAKNALIQPAVQLPAMTPGSVVPFSEFYGCAYPNPVAANPANPSQPVINLFTYNRCVGQALLIAINAKAESDAGAGATPLTNAQSVLNDLNAIGKTLKNGMQGTNTASSGLSFDPNNPPSSLGANFTKNANSSNVAMFNQTNTAAPVQGATSYKTAWMKTGGATNVYFAAPFTPTSVPDMAPGGAATTATVANYGVTNPTSQPDPLNQNQAQTGKFYLQGYSGITVPGTSMTFYGVPVLPQQKPHLVSTDDFNASQSDIYNGVVPPNSFQVNATAQNNGGNFGGAVSCAIVGAVFQNTGAGAVSPDFPVAIPSGYIELVNPAGNFNNQSVPTAFWPSDNSGNIFNNELYDDPSQNVHGGLPGNGQGSGDLYTASTTTGSVFGEQAAIQAWLNYNTSPTVAGSYNATTNPLGRNANLYPPTHGQAAPSGLIYNHNGVEATPAVCQTITGNLQDCTMQAGLATGLSGNCLNDITAFEAVYNGPPQPGTAGTSPPGGISAVDTIKGALIANFNGAGYHKTISIGTVGTGTATTLTASSTDGNGNVDPNSPGNGLKGYTGLGEYMGPNGENGVFATPNPGNKDWNQFPIQNTGTTYLPSGGHPSILGLLAQLDSGNGTTASGGGGASPNNNYFQAPYTSQCGGIFQALLARVQQIQPACTALQLEALLNGQVESKTGLQYSLEMGQTAYIFLNNSNLADTSGVTTHGLRIYAVTTGQTPGPLASWTASQPDGMPTNNIPPSCGQSPYAIVKQGDGLVDVNIDYAGPGGKGDDDLHEQPYTQIAGDYNATDKGSWIPSSGYGNILGQLQFSETVQGSANFSAPN